MSRGTDFGSTFRLRETYLADRYAALYELFVDARGAYGDGLVALARDLPWVRRGK